MSCVCIIPARGGSIRIPRKNIREFHGKPIIAYSIEAAQATGIFDAIYVSTDDDEIAEVAVQFGAAILRRSPEMSHDSVGTQEVMRDAIRRIIGVEIKNDYVCCLYATAPMVSVDEIREAYDILVDGSTDYVVPVATWLRDPGQFYFGLSGAFMTGVDLIDPGTAMIKSDPARECDINTFYDWGVAERMYEALQERGNE
jgi:pseudaminic acid cytidylyltransferase